MVYASVSRGYKSGGFNTDGTLDADLRQFDPETLYNAEIGVKGNWRDDTLVGRLALFYMWRDDMQVDTSQIRMRPDGSSEFIEYTGNASKGDNYGLEAELHFRPTQRIELFGSLGLLSSEYRDFVNGAGQELDGRQQAQAPSYQFFVERPIRLAERLVCECRRRRKGRVLFLGQQCVPVETVRTRSSELRSQTGTTGG